MFNDSSLYSVCDAVQIMTVEYGNFCIGRRVPGRTLEMRVLKRGRNMAYLLGDGFTALAEFMLGKTENRGCRLGFQLV